MHMYTFDDGLMSNKSKTWDTQKEFVKNVKYFTKDSPHQKNQSYSYLTFKLNFFIMIFELNSMKK